MAPGQEMPTDPVVSIGSRCLIGRGSHIVGHWEIVIGDDIQTGPYVYITDQNHTYLDPVEPIGRQWPTEAAVRIGSGSWLGANAVILPGAQIGEHVVVAAGAVVRGDVPDRCVVAGVPARIVRRWVEGAGLGRREGPDAAVTRTDGRTVAPPGDGERPGRPGHRRAAVRRSGRAQASTSTTWSRSECTAACCSASRSAVRADAGRADVRGALAAALDGAGVEVAVDPLVEADTDAARPSATWSRVLAPEIDASTLEGVTGGIARRGGNIERIVRLAAYPVHCYELTVAGADLEQLRRPWPRRRCAARSTSRSRRPGCTAGPST